MIIPDFPAYDITPSGIITNIKLEKVITPVVRNGYLSVRLSRDKKLHHKSLHRLVYEVFRGSIPYGYHIDHIDGIRMNNSIRNLRAVTSKENNLNRKYLRRGTEVNTSKLTEEQVAEIRLAKSTGANSMSLAQKYSVQKSTINRIATGKTWKHLPILSVDNSQWGSSSLTGAMSGSKLREKYGKDYFAKVAKAQKIKKHCSTCTCVD